MLPSRDQLVAGRAQKVPLYLLPLLTLPIMKIFGGGQEEPGWRGYLQPQLETLLVANLWPFGHWPLFVRPGYPPNDMPNWQ